MTDRPVTDAVASVIFDTIPDEARQKTATAEVSKFFQLRKCRFVIQQELGPQNGWCLKLLVRFPPTHPQFQSIRRSMINLLKSDRLGLKHFREVHVVKCNEEQSRALDQRFCQDQSVETRKLPCVTPAASGSSEVLSTRFQRSYAC